MSKQPSATMMKGRNSAPQHQVPREGSSLRRVWDLLYSRAGVWVPIAEISAAYGKNVGNHGTGNFITVLRTEYGLDIRCGYGAWLLAGEHVGVAYLDYVADPTLAQGRPNPAGREV